MEPEPPELNARLGAVWEFARDLAKRVEKLETSRAEDRAVSAWRHWAIPLALSTIAVAVAVASFLLPRHR